MKRIKRAGIFLLLIMLIFSSISLQQVEAKSAKKSDFSASVVYHTTNIINAQKGHKEKPGVKIVYKNKNIKTTSQKISKKKISKKAKISFTSSNTDVASINKKTGEIKCKKSGTTIVTMHVFYRPSKKFHFNGEVSTEVKINITK